MKKSIKIWLIAAMAAVSGSVWGDGTTFPIGTYIFDLKTNFALNPVTEFNVFEPSAMRDKVDDMDGTHACNSGITMNDSRRHYYRTDGSSSFEYLVLTTNTSYDASFNDSFLSVCYGGSWHGTDGGNWTHFGTHTLSPVEGTTDVYLCIVHADGSFEWSTDDADLPVCAGNDPVLRFQAADAHGSITTHTVNGVSTPSNSAVTSGSSVILVATPAEGYKFRDWTDASSNVVSTNATYAFTITSSVNLTANFEVDNTDPAISGCSGCFRVAP